jgi:uncharacterized protein YbjT (DUF2867 family)
MAKVMVLKVPNLKVSNLKVLVLGGAGFIGRHACLALHQAGATVVIGSRDPEQIEARLAPELWGYERRQVQVDQLTEPDAWSDVLQGIDVVLNCVGILRQRGEQTYQRVHCEGPAALANYSAQTNLRFIQVSALGLRENAKSRFLSSKLLGEQAIKRTTGNWIIARPSLLDGEGGYGAWWLRAVAQLPLFVVPADAKGLLAALDVGELGEALTALCLGSAEQLQLDRSREFDLGGPTELNFRQYIETLRLNYTNKAALCITVPGMLARLGAHLCDLFHVTPFSFGHWELLQQDNKPRENRLAELIGRPPKSVGALETLQ